MRLMILSYLLSYPKSRDAIESKKAWYDYLACTTLVPTRLIRYYFSIFIVKAETLKRKLSLRKITRTSEKRNDCCWLLILYLYKINILEIPQSLPLIANSRYSNQFQLTLLNSFFVLLMV